VVLQELRVHHGTARVFAAQLQVVGYVLGLSQIPSLVAHTILTLFVHTHRLGQKRVGRLNRQHHRGLGTYFPFTTHRLCNCPYSYQNGLLPLTVYSYTLRETDTFLFYNQTTRHRRLRISCFPSKPRRLKARRSRSSRTSRLVVSRIPES